jgi:hypothetical protein
VLTGRLIELIETHADTLTQATLKDLDTNPRTRAMQQVPRNELEARVFATYGNLGRFMGDRSDRAVQADYETWGARRCRQGIPLSAILWALIVVKQHVRRFVRDHGLVEFSGDRVAGPDLVGVQLHGIQELNYMVGDFFDRAMYHLTRGYEAAASAHPPGSPTLP